MQVTNRIIQILLLTSTFFVLSACSSGGSGSQTGLNISGRWVGTTVVGSATRTVTMTLAQQDAATVGVKSTTVDGNLLIDQVCVFTFSGGELNLVTNNLTIGAGDDFTLIASVSNSSISGTFSSLDDDPTDSEGCGTFLSSVNFHRA